MIEIFIRPVQIGDETEICKNLFTSTNYLDLRNDIESINKQIWLFGLVNQKIVSIIILVPNNHILHKHMIEFCSLVVSEKYRKKGIATKMINEALNIAKVNNFEIVTASARHNANSISLLNKVGFIRTHTIKNGIKEADGKYFNFINFIKYL